MSPQRTKQAAIQWVRPPQQGRAQRTLARLLDACAALLDEDSFEAITIADIVARADSSVGAFYVRFASKEALLHALHERYAEEARATAASALAPAAWEGVPLREVVGRFCAFVVRAHDEQAGLKRALLLASAHDADHRARAVGLGAFVTGYIRGMLVQRRAEHGHEDPAVAADVVHRLLFAALDQELMFGKQPAGRRLSRAALARELADAVARYLLIAG